MGYLKTFNNREFVPCEPTDELRGGIFADKIQNIENMVEVKLGSNGKAYVNIDSRVQELLNALGYAEEESY